MTDAPTNRQTDGQNCSS